MTEPVDPQQARELLERAGQLSAASRSGAGWPQITMLLGLGASSSMFMVALHLVMLADERLVWLPMVIMLLWLAILSVTMLGFARATKVGFSRRWWTVILVWGVVWVVSMLGITVWWPGQLWFAVTAALVLTVVCTFGGWREARR